MADSFVYCWTDIKTCKLYIGSHKGNIDDGYICSSKYMKEEYYKRPNDFSRVIIAEGDEKDIRILESKILKSVNARKSNDFYNKTEGDGKFYFSGERGNFSEEHKLKLSESRKNQAMSKDHMNKLHEGRKNSKNSDAHNLALKNSRLGSKHNEITKRKMSDSKINNPNTKINAISAGKKSGERWKNDEELKAKHKETMKKWWAARKGLLNGSD